MGVLKTAVETWQLIINTGYDPKGKVFLEIGTGWIPIVPLAYYLMGAKRTITIDLNPYIKEDLIKECLQYVSVNTEKIKNTFGPLLDNKRLDAITDLPKQGNYNVEQFYNLCGIEYIAPGDAAHTILSPNSIDIHTSNYVMEHIPPEILVAIIKEGNRIIKQNGLFVHNIDYSDHFSHSDKTIVPINFLQFTEKEWIKYAGNRFMYMNRLRHDDFINIFLKCDHRILVNETNTNQTIYELLKKNSIKLDSRFKNKSIEVNSILRARLITQKCVKE